MAHPVGPWDVSFEDHTSELTALNDALDLFPGETAAVTIDMHRGHLDSVDATMPVDATTAAKVVDASATLLSHLRELGVPVIHVVLSWRPDEAYSFSPRVEAGRIVLSNQAPTTRAMAAGTVHNLIGSVQCEVMPELGPFDGDRVVDTKKTLSSFLGTELDVMLNRWVPVRNLILLGINTNTCVQCAAFEATNRGFRVIVPPECVASMYGEDMHRAALQNIARCLGWVVPAEEIVAKLRAQQPAFA